MWHQHLISIIRKLHTAKYHNKSVRLNSSRTPWTARSWLWLSHRACSDRLVRPGPWTRSDHPSHKLRGWCENIHAIVQITNATTTLTEISELTYSRKRNYTPQHSTTFKATYKTYWALLVAHNTNYWLNATFSELACNTNRWFKYKFDSQGPGFKLRPSHSVWCMPSSWLLNEAKPPDS